MGGEKQGKTTEDIWDIGIQEWTGINPEEASRLAEARGRWRASTRPQKLVSEPPDVERDLKGCSTATGV